MIRPRPTVATREMQLMDTVHDDQAELTRARHADGMAAYREKGMQRALACFRQ